MCFGVLCLILKILNLQILGVFILKIHMNIWLILLHIINKKFPFLKNIKYSLVEALHNLDSVDLHVEVSVLR